MNYFDCSRPNNTCVEWEVCFLLNTGNFSWWWFWNRMITVIWRIVTMWTRRGIVCVRGKDILSAETDKKDWMICLPSVHSSQKRFWDGTYKDQKVKEGQLRRRERQKYISIREIINPWKRKTQDFSILICIELCLLMSCTSWLL